MKKARVFFATALLYSLHGAAQYTLDGQVISGTGELVPFAVIGLKNTQLSTVANAEGIFKFKNLKKGRYVLMTRSTGFLDRTDTLEVNDNINFKPVLVESNKQLDEVVVNATRVDNNSGMAYSNVDAETLKKQNLGQDAPYMLNRLTGVVVNSDAGNGVGYTGIRIRGSDATRINVTVNGVPINDAESQGSFFVDMPDFVSSVNNIQVQRGVGASSNGAGAFGASINFQTNELKDKPYANLISTAGSFDTYRNTISAGTGLLNNKFTLDARASNITSNGYIDRAASNLQSYYVAGGYYGKKTVIKFINFTGWEKTYQAWNLVNEDSIKRGNRTYNELGQYTDANGHIQFYNNQTDNYMQSNSQLHFIHQVNSKISFNLTGHYTKGKGYYEEYKQGESFSTYGLANPQLLLPDSVPVTTTDVVRRLWLDNDFAGALFNVNYTAASNLNFILGGGYNSYYGRHYDQLIWTQYASNSQIDYQYDHNTANKNDGNVYLKTNYKPADGLNIFVDLQVRKVAYRFLGINAAFAEQTQNKTFVFFNPKCGISYNATKSLNIYASAAVGNKEPNRNDFVENTPEHQPKAEQLLDMEAGAKYKLNKVYFSVNLYNMQYKNQLVLNGQLDDVGAAKRVNVDKSFRRGIEVELNTDLNKYLSFGGNVALSQNKIAKFTEYIDSSNADYSVYTQHVNQYKNTDISFSPNVVASVILTIRPVHNLEITFINKSIGRQFLDNTGNVNRSINPYNALNVQMNYRIRTKVIPEISFMLSVYNVLNAKYETNGYTFSYYYDSSNLTTTNYLAPSAPVNFLGGVSLKF